MIGQVGETGRVQRPRGSRRPCRRSCRWGRPCRRRPGRGPPPAWPSSSSVAIVVDVEPAGRAADRAAMAVVGVFAAADVGDDQEIAGRLLGRADRLGDDARVAGGVAAQGVLLGGNAEEHHAAQPQFDRPGGFPRPACRAKAGMAGHGRDRLAHFFARAARTAAESNWPARAASRGPVRGPPDDSEAVAAEWWETCFAPRRTVHGRLPTAASCSIWILPMRPDFDNARPYFCRASRARRTASAAQGFSP